MTDVHSSHPPAVTRRTVATGLAWSVPAVAAVASAPFAAASVIKEPGINGWVLNSTDPQGNCGYQLTVNSRPSNPGRTPDGAPYGLYLYDTDPRGRYDNAKMVYWIRGDHKTSNPVSWTTLSGHSPCWGTQTIGEPVVKDDGFVYTPYTWTYSCDIDPTDVQSDGRLYLGTFRVRASFTQAGQGWGCEPLDYWTYREIRVDPDGDGSQPAEIQFFERRNGASGPFPGSSPRRADAVQSDEVGVAVQADS